MGSLWPFCGIFGCSFWEQVDFPLDPNTVKLVGSTATKGFAVFSMVQVLLEPATHFQKPGNPLVCPHWRHGGGVVRG